MAFDLTLQADFAARGRRGCLDFTFSGKALKDREHFDLSEHYDREFEALAESFSKVKLEDKDGEADAGPAGPAGVAPCRPWPQDLRPPVPCSSFQPKALKKQRKRGRDEDAPREAVRAWEAMVKDAFWMKNHPRMLEFLHFFQWAARIDRPWKVRGEQLVMWAVPGHWMTEVHQAFYAGTCKDFFNKIALEDLAAREDLKRRHRRGLPVDRDIWAHRPAALMGMRRAVKAERALQALKTQASKGVAVAAEDGEWVERWVTLTVSEGP